MSYYPTKSIDALKASETETDAMLADLEMSRRVYLKSLAKIAYQIVSRRAERGEVILDSEYTALDECRNVLHYM